MTNNQDIQDVLDFELDEETINKKRQLVKYAIIYFLLMIGLGILSSRLRYIGDLSIITYFSSTLAYLISSFIIATIINIIFFLIDWKVKKFRKLPFWYSQFKFSFVFLLIVTLLMVIK